MSISLPHKSLTPLSWKTRQGALSPYGPRRHWIPHGGEYKEIASYCPKVVCDGDMGDIYDGEFDVGGLTLPDVSNMNAVGKYAGRNARWGNALIIRDFE